MNPGKSKVMVFKRRKEEVDDFNTVYRVRLLAVARLKCGKAAGMDGITAEMLKYGGDAAVEWMLLICEQAWKKGEVPDDWKKAIIVPLDKGKGSRSECRSYRGISLLSVPGKVYGRILTERLMEVTEGKVSEEQGGFRKGRGCIDQIFAMKR